MVGEVDIRIMACRSREPMVNAMLGQLRLPDSIVTYDDRPEGGSAMRTARRAWLSPMPERASHRLVLQDDVELCHHFRDIIAIAVQMFPDAAWTLYHPRLRMENRRERSSPYVLIPGGAVWGQAILMPAAYIRRCFDWIGGTLGVDYRHDDNAISSYLAWHAIRVMTTIPSTVQHLAPMDSLLGFNNPRKVSKVWRGPDLSGESWLTRSYSTAPHVLTVLHRQPEQAEQFAAQRDARYAP